MTSRDDDDMRVETSESVSPEAVEQADDVPRCVVKSWNEWDPLRHVIVGRADDSHIPAPEPGVVCKVPKDSEMLGRWGRRTAESVAAANEELDAFSSLLASRGIRVDRPTPIDFGQAVRTPDFEAESMIRCIRRATSS